MTPDGGPSWPEITTERMRVVVELEIDQTVAINGVPWERGDPMEVGRVLVDTATDMDASWESTTVVSARWVD